MWEVHKVNTAGTPMPSDDNNQRYEAIDAGTFSDRFDCLHKYQGLLSLRGARHYLALRVSQALPATARGHLHVFVRQPMCTDVCPVSMFHIAANTATPIALPSYSRGLHPLCKVLDLLAPSRAFANGFALRVDICEEMAPAPFCGLAEIVANEARPGFPTYGRPPANVAHYKHMVLFTKSLCAHGSALSILNSDQLHILDEATSYPALFADRTLLHETMCGAEIISRWLDMPFSMFTYKLLAASLAEAILSSPPDASADTILTTVKPVADPFLFGASLSFIGSRQNADMSFDALGRILHEDVAKINEYMLNRSEQPYIDNELAKRSIVAGLVPEHGLQSIRMFSHRNPPDKSVPAAIGQQIKTRLREAAGASSADSLFLRERRRDVAGKNVDIANTFQAFLGLCSTFCDEEHENVSQEFGLLLSNPASLEVCTGPRLIPLCNEMRGGGLYEWSTLDEVRKRIELVSDPRDRCVVIPYSENLSKDGHSQQPAFVCDLRPFRELAASMPEVALWSSLHSVYVALTLLYPWSVAVLAGPGAQLKVFAGGDLVAFRDGKGWRVWEDPASELRKDYPTASSSFLECLSGVLRVAKQVSKYVRPGRHGALIVYEPDEGKMKEWKEDKRIVPLRPKHAPTLAGLGWEENRSLFLRSRDGSRQIMNHETARFMFRAASLDGAICLTGTEARVHSIAQSLRFEGGGESAGGTKRLAARAFAKHCSPHGFAVAVSTDGPVRVVFKQPDGATSDEMNCFRLEE